MPRIKKSIPLILILFLSYFSMRFLLKPGFFPTHDNTQIARVFQMRKSLSTLQFPVRWVADLGYGFGYPIFNFYNPLPYYFGGIINLLGLTSLLSTKLMFIFAIIASGFSMYFLAREFFGPIGGIVSSLFYLYAPYHAVQIYVRGAVAELWAYAFLPLIFLFLYQLYQATKFKKPPKKYIILSSLILAILVLSHNLSVVIWLPSIIVFITLLSALLTKKSRITFMLSCFYVFMLGLSLSCFFWLPALMEKGFTSVDFMVSQKFNPLEHFVFPDQLWFAFFGYGGSIPGRPDGLSFQAGKLHLLFILLAILLFLKSLRGDKKFKETNRIILFFLVSFFFSLFMMLQASRPIWQIFYPLLSYLQFPWRFLLFAAFTSSFLAGSIFLKFKSKKNLKLLSFSFIIIALIFVNYRYFQPLYTGVAEDKDFLSDQKIKWETSLTSDEYLPPDFPRPESFESLPKEKFFLQKNADLVLKLEKPHQYNLEINTPQDNLLTANIAYFPGWQATIDDKKASILEDRGVINLYIPQGKHQVDLSFENTPLRTFANLISLVSFLFLLPFLIKSKMDKAEFC